MKPVFIMLIFSLTFNPVLLFGQDSIAHSIKLVRIWVYDDNNSAVKGVLIGASDSVLVVYQGSISAYKKESSPALMRINYKNIRLIKIKKSGGVLKGALIGGVIGFTPAFFGEGGAYAAIITLPAGLITGAIIGATSKRKYAIHGDAKAFGKFRHKWIKE